ncbi:uncharacterized protein J4E88_010218 [Alternaria novae-zelandiae]|uniref:uncharacterized protein n=1 Tax=Alternaria novae-zelandiae TaxID=430562 RepID=UPI0020C25F59|nr:uncharacterized protein J4E88_010218 [Alternaria novae-zelandiae]KAI4667698.1 hypothetical protein J4E88_010218 [Alternaria novae-zelandiae]
MVDRIQAIIEDDFKHAPESTLYDLHSISAGPHHHTYTDRDRALMAILCSLRTLPFARQAQNNWYPQGLPISKDNNLVLYNHTVGLGVKQTAISLDSFVDLAQSWLYVRNPASLSGVDPSAKNSWKGIANTLSNAGVDIRKIDLQLWEALTYRFEGDDLTAAIDDVIEWSKDGTLDSRHAAWRDHAISNAKNIPESLSSDGMAPTSTRPHSTGLYTKRFSHKHPLGRPRSLISDDEKAELRRDRAARLTAEAAAKKIEDQRKEKREKSKGCFYKVRRGWRKRKSMVWFVCFIVVILSGIMGGLVWAMASGKLDFTPGGEGV